MKCDLPGCPETTDEDGYCDLCLERPSDRVRREAGKADPVVPVPATVGQDTSDIRSPGTIPLSPARPDVTRPGSEDHGRPAVPPPTAPLTTGPWWGLDLVPAPVARGAAGAEPVLLTDASVPEGDWRCRRCHEPVGVSHHGQPALREGRCPMCGTPYSPEAYKPRLRRGDVVNDRYEVFGCTGQGGVGWVYAAQDRHLEDQWVALKGLIDSADEKRKDAVKAEKHFLLSIDHQRIVRIVDSVFHPGDDGLDLYLVMEFIEGYPLDDARFLTHSLEDAIAAVLQILQAMDYLHRHDYLYCDLKPGNVMLSPSGVKLIDLGAVNSGWRTRKFAAPELASTGPNVATDLHTVGRTLEDLTKRWKPLPAALRSMIDCATQSEPSYRFGSAAAFADQLSGVLNMLTARPDGPGRLAPSRLFAPGAEALDGGLGATPLEWWTSTAAQDAAEAGTCRLLPVDLPAFGKVAARLPEPHPDPRDSAAGYLATSLSTDPGTAAGQLDAYVGPTAEIRLRRCRVHLSLGEIDAARSVLDELPPTEDGWRRGWLVHWHRGLIALADGKADVAAVGFAACSALVPGETAPRLAYALCQEYRDAADAESLYEAVWTADRSFEAAVFGLARVLLRGGDRAAAVRALDRVPGTSPYHHTAASGAIRILSGRLKGGPDGLPEAADLRAAAERLRDGRFADAERQRLRAVILEAALELAGSGRTLPDVDPLSATDGVGEIRTKLEETYRGFCDQTADGDVKTILVDLANHVRQVTLS